MTWDHKQSIKEVIRHMALMLGANSLLLRHRETRGFVVRHLEALTPAERFGEAYRLGTWVHSADQISFSGRGSEEGATTDLSQALPQLLRRRRCRTLLDIGCGDWNWMRRIELPCDYIGVDIVPEIIQRNRRLYERRGVRFEVADAISGPLPQADIALCREVLFHLSFRDGLSLLRNLRKSASWLLATSDSTIWFNSDILTGDFRKINLQRSPYGLADMQEAIKDDAVSYGRYLGLWKL